MSVDPEIEQRFDALESAMVRLAAAQAKTEARVGELASDMQKLAAAQARTEARVGELAEGLGTLTDRVDRLAQLMIRGHTEAAERHVAVIQRLDELEGR